MKRTIIIILLIFSIFQVFLRDFYLTHKTELAGGQPDLFYLPESKYVKLFMFDYDSFASSLIWVKTIGYFADQFIGSQNYKYLEKLLYIISDLDPMFEKAYLWGGSVLMYNGNWITRERVERSTKYLKYGWNNIKNQPYKYRHTYDYWRIPHMIGFNYAIELKEIEKGIPYIEEVAKIPTAPSFYRTWVSTLYRKAGNKDQAAKVLERELIIENLRSALSQSMDRSLKEQIVGRLRKLYRGLYDEEEVSKRIDELISQSMRMRSLYLNNFPYLTKEMFFMLGADRALSQENISIIDALYYRDLI